MAAYVVFPSESEWEIISRFLSNCGDGAIVIPPDVATELQEVFGNSGLGDAFLEMDGRLIDYDFGGEADMFLDVVSTKEHSAVNAISEAMEDEADWTVEEDEEGDDAE